MPFDNTSESIEPISSHLDNRTDIKLVNEQINIAKLDKKSIDAEFYPTLSGVYNYGFTGYNDSFSFTKTINEQWVKSSYVGLQLNIPLFSGFSKSQKLKQKEIEISKAQNNLELLKSAAQKELSDSENNYFSRRNSVENTQRSLNLAIDLLKNSGIEYQNGLISISELILAQNELSDARNNYSNALIQMKIAELEIKKANGNLTSNK